MKKTNIKKHGADGAGEETRRAGRAGKEFDAADMVAAAGAVTAAEAVGPGAVGLQTLSPGGSYVRRPGNPTTHNNTHNMTRETSTAAKLCVIREGPQLNRVEQILVGEDGLRIHRVVESLDAAAGRGDWSDVDGIICGAFNRAAFAKISALKAVAHMTPLACVVDESDEYFTMEAVRAGALGIILRNGPASEMAATVHAMLNGGAYFPAVCMRQIVTRLRGFVSANMPEAAPQVTLTAKEVEICRKLMQGFSAKETAATMGISHSTVCTHMKHIYAKLRAHTKAEAIKKCRILGLCVS